MILCHEVLCVIRAIKILSTRVLTRASMISSDNEMRCTKVFSDNGMPNGFTRACHAHREWKEGQMAHAIGVLGHDGLVNANAGVVVNIARLGQTNDGMY